MKILLAVVVFGLGACTQVVVEEGSPSTGGAGGSQAGSGGGSTSGGSAGVAGAGGGAGAAGTGQTDAGEDQGLEGGEDAAQDADAAPVKWWTDKVDGCDQKAGIVCCPLTGPIGCGDVNKSWVGWTHWGAKCSVNPGGGIAPILPAGTLCYPWPGSVTPSDWCCEP